MVRFGLLTILILCSLSVLGQRRLSNLLENNNFNWSVVSPTNNLYIYIEKESYAEVFKGQVIENILTHIRTTRSFLGLQYYGKSIHYFIVENRSRMALLIGHETNGSANFKENYITAIFSESINSVSSNHELFHLIAMNAWGKPEHWFNEAMAVYSDNQWHGFDLHELANYLHVNNKTISLKKIRKNLRKYDSMITYPLLGSFAKYLDQTYGRELIQAIWNRDWKKLKYSHKKSLADLEREWLEFISEMAANDIERYNEKGVWSQF